MNRFYRRASEMVKLANPTSIIDLGCGEGFAMSELRSRGVSAEFSGIDFSERALQDARGRLGEDVQLICGDVTDLANQDSKYDLVLMLEVLEHIEGPEQMLPVLRSFSAGYILLSVPWEPFFRGLNLLRGKNVRRWGNDPEHVNHWSRRSFRRWVETEFEIVASPGVFPWSMVLLKVTQ